MKIKSFYVKNYKVLDDFKIEFDDENITILLGTNNVGKSTFLEALNKFMQIDGPKEEDFNKNKIGSNENFEFEMIALNNNGEEVTLKSTYNSTGKRPAYYIDNTSQSKKYFEKYIEDCMTNPFYVAPDSKAEDNEKEILKLFQTTAQNIITDDTEKNNEFNAIAKKIDELLDEANNALEPSIKELRKNIRDDLNRIFGEELGSLNIKFETNEFGLDDYAKLISSEIQFNKNGNEFKLSSQGTGVRRASFISLLQNAMKEEKLIFKNNHLLLIDEPEVFLHPMAVKELSNILYDIAGEKLQIIISTHSPIFVDLYKGLNKTIRVLKIDNNVKQLFSTTKNTFDDNEVANIKMLTLTNPYFNEFFFAKRILIIEGDSEYILFNECIKKYLLDEGKGKLPTHIINAKGKWTIATIQRILNEFKANYYIYHDLDLDKATEDNNLIQANERIKGLAFENEYAHVIANKSTLEVTLYGQRCTNSQKTKKAVDLIDKLNSGETCKELEVIFNIIRWLYNEKVTLDKEIEIIKY